MHHHQLPTPIKSCQQHRLQLHWLLVLAILLQSVGPTAWAAAGTALNSERVSTDHGFWTISCAGRPMWLPILQLAETRNGIKRGAAEHSDHALHCVICSNLADSEGLTSSTRYPAPGLFADAITSNYNALALAASLVHKLYHPRAPPVFPEQEV